MVVELVYRPNNIPNNGPNHLNLPDIIAHRGIPPAAVQSTGAKKHRAAGQ
jgi:hypothetical protein